MAPCCVVSFLFACSATSILISLFVDNLWHVLHLHDMKFMFDIAPYYYGDNYKFLIPLIVLYYSDS